MPRVVPSQVVAFIDQVFDWAAKQLVQNGPEITLACTSSPEVTALLELVDSIPPNLIVLAGNEYTQFVYCVSGLRAALQTWQTDRNYLLRNLQKSPRLHPVTLIRRALLTCPDEYPQAAAHGLDFIPDLELRDELRVDLSSLEVALSNGEWKATTVIAGSISEALLLSALQQKPSQQDVLDSAVKLTDKGTFSKHPGNNLEEWTLHNYIEVAKDLRVITEDTAVQTRLAKNFRNLIHPGRTQRLNQRCDRATAFSAVASVFHVIRNLTKP
jgi:hypothetical protein